MIERIELQSDRTDWASLLGRGTLAGGTLYAGYRTFKDVGISPTNVGHFRKKMSKLSTHTEMAQRTAQDVYGISYEKLLGGTKADFKMKISQIAPEGRLKVPDVFKEQLSMYGTGYKGQSAQLYDQVMGLYEDISQRGGKPVITTKGLDAGAGQIRLKAELAGRDISFDISPVSREGTISLGDSLENKYAARSVLKDFNAVTGEAIGADVALTRRYRESLDQIITGEVNPRDIARTMNERAIFEKSRGAKDFAKTQSSVLGKLRREQVVVDPFQELTSKALQERMKRLMKIPGFSAGNASQFSKGILNTPASPISSGLPAAAESASAYQLFRPSEFTGIKPSTIAWSEAQNFAEFKVATVNDQEALKRVLKQRGYKVGEIAAEEVLLNNTNNAGVKNRLYTYNIDLQRDVNKSTYRLLKRISNETGMSIEGTGAAMRQPGGLTDVGIDINQGYKKILGRKNALEADLKFLDRMNTDRVVAGGKTRDRKYITRSLEKVNEALKEQSILGYAPGSDQVVKLKGAEDLENKITSMRIRNDKLSIATESHFKFAEGSKVWSGGGGGKWTIKGTVNDLPGIAAEIAREEEYMSRGFSPISIAEREKDLKRYREGFKDIDMISVENPIKVSKGGSIAGRDITAATMSYATNLAQDTQMAQGEKIRRLKELGVESGRYISNNMSGEQIISKIKGWHNNASLNEIFEGKRYPGVTFNNILLSTDIHSIQSGFSGLGTLSERAAYNISALGLDEFGKEIFGRRALPFDPLAQYRELKVGQELARDTTVKGLKVGQFSDYNVLNAAFQSDLPERRDYLKRKFKKENRMTINLGKKIAGIDKVNIYASDTLAPYIGKQVGGSMTELDRTTKELLASVAGNAPEERQTALAKKYKKAIQITQESIEKNLFKGKVTGSMYGQATSALEGMDESARSLGKAMGMEGMSAPLIAMSKRDIAKRLNMYDDAGNMVFDAVKAAKTVDKKTGASELWGMISRMPVEGVHSTIPANIRIAEDYGIKNAKKGMIYLSGEDAANSMLRKSLFVDFDKDPLHVIAATTEKSTNELKDFMMNKKNVMGREYKQSLARMSAFDLKSKSTKGIGEIDEMLRLEAGIATKNLEKGSIGIFSNEFKNIHIGLREQLVQNMSEAKSKSFYLGEDLSHLYLENILKAKHQSAEGIVKGKAQKVLDILQSKDSHSLQKRTVALQSAFDEMVFGGEEGRRIGEEIRGLQAEQNVSADLAARMGYTDDLTDAATISAKEARIAREGEILRKATSQAQAHRSISSFGNVENVIRAHDVGAELQATEGYAANIVGRSLNSRSKLLSTLDDAKAATSKIMSKGLRNVGKYAILPTAAIGLMASMTSTPRTLEPVMDAGEKHEGEHEDTEVRIPKTIYDIPSSSVTSAQIKGQVSRNTNYEYLDQMKNRAGADIRISDHRSHTNKYTVDEMIKRGY